MSIETEQLTYVMDLIEDYGQRVNDQSEYDIIEPFAEPGLFCISGIWNYEAHHSAIHEMIVNNNCIYTIETTTDDSADDEPFYIYTYTIHDNSADAGESL